MSKFSKRKWKPVYNLNGSWYTGWSRDIHEDNKKYYKKNAKVGKEHFSKDLTVKLNGYGRGRSAANFDVKDEEGNSYMMSMSGFYSLLEQVLDMNTDIKRGGYFTATFMQTKQGANYFIAPYEE